MKVKITKCSEPAYWYEDVIGDEFEVIESNTYSYNVKDGDVTRSILKSDCEFVQDFPEIGTYKEVEHGKIPPVPEPSISDLIVEIISVVGDDPKVKLAVMTTYYWMKSNGKLKI